MKLIMMDVLLVPQFILLPPLKYIAGIYFY